MTTNIEEIDVQTAAIKTLSDPWFGLLGAEVAAAAAILKDLGLTAYDDAVRNAVALAGEATSQAAKTQGLERIWGELAGGLRNDLIGLRERLQDTQKAWADRAIQQFDDAAALEAKLSQGSATLTRDTLAAAAKHAAAFVGVAQLASAMLEEDGNPSFNTVCRRAFKIDQLCALNFDQGR